MRARLYLGLLGLVGLVTVTGCDSLFGPDDRPPADLTRNTLPSSVVVGQAIEARVTVKDKDGKALKGEEVSWAPAGGGTVSVATSSTDGDGIGRTTWTLGTEVGQQTLKATVRDLETTFIVTAHPGALATITITPGGATMTSLGDSLALSAAGADAYGNDVPLGGLTWSSSAPTVADVTRSGVVVSHGEGEAEIQASLGGVAASVPVVVDQVVVGVAVEAWTTVLARSETVQLTGRAVDARGAPVDTALSVSWSSSAPSVAAVSETGVLEALTEGSAVITASASPFEGTAEVTVKAGPRPTVTSIAPAVLEAGTEATITGTGFSTTVALNEVTVAGVPATVTAATTTTLTVTMPPAGSFPCGPTGARAVDVAVDGLVVSTDHPLAGAPQRDLAVGEAVTLDGAGLGCNELAVPGRYVMTVFNTEPSPVAVTGFQVRGSGGATTAASPLAAAWAWTPRIQVDPAPARQDGVDPADKAHLRMLERNRALLDRLGAREPQAALPHMEVSAAPAVGELRTFRIPDLDGENICQDFQRVTARVVYAGAKGVIYEDTLAPLAGAMDDTWRRVGEEFDGVMYPVLTEYFGDPLAFDAQLDNDGRFNMLFSKFVNDMEAGVAGFVFSGDFFPRPQCGSSDEGEIFYGRVPTATGTGYDGYTADAWLWGIRSTVIHEVKHITSYAHKLRDAPEGGSPNYEESWLEESTARLAEEFYARALFGYGQGDNVGYQESIYCEIRVGANWPDCDPFPSIMVKHFGGVNDYLKSIESLSPVGKVGESDWSFYGSGWLFVRWALDQSGVPEADFVRALIDEDGVTGVRNIERRTGRSFRELLGDFTLALAIDDEPGVVPADPAHAHRGWNTRDIFRGLNEDYAGTDLADRFDRPWPLQARQLPAGTFTASVPSLQGGTTTVFELSVQAGQPQLLRILGATGGPAPAALGMSLVRVQ